MQCTGEETSLLYCPHSAWGESNCVHAEDAAVICSGNLIIYIICELRFGATLC